MYLTVCNSCIKIHFGKTIIKVYFTRLLSPFAVCTQIGQLFESLNFVWKSTNHCHRRKRRFRNSSECLKTHFAAKLLWEFFQNYLVVHELQEAVKNNVCYTPDSLFWTVLYAYSTTVLSVAHYHRTFFERLLLHILRYGIVL